MPQITAAMVKELREKTGAGMMDCKKALAETDGNPEMAVDWLRGKGLSAAAKRAGRVAAEGLVAVALQDGKGVVVEVNSETDFVARNETFQALARAIADLAVAGDGGVAEILALPCPGTNRTVDEEIAHAVATIGENIRLRRAGRVAARPGHVASYVHNSVVPGMGKIGVVVALGSEAPMATLDALGRQLAMHIAAANPASVTVDDLDRELVERERAVLSQQARESGRPEAIIAKMIEGRMRKFYQEVVLLEQTFVVDGESKVGDVIARAAKEAGHEIAVTGFVRYALGEGIEREKADFAAEVAAVQAGS